MEEVRLSPNIVHSCQPYFNPLNQTIMKKSEALKLFNSWLTGYGLQPISEGDAIDVIYEGMTESEVREAASDWANEEHTAKCENKFWAEHDWQQD